MTLPYAAEIADLRARTDAGQHATTMSQHAKAALTAVSVVEVQHARGLPVPKELPGEDLIDELMVSFAGLAELDRVGAHAKDYGQRLLARRQQLEIAVEHLAPRVAEVESLAGELHTLRHKQHHELEKPEWAEAVAQLRELAHSRDQLALQLAPLRSQLAHVEPVRQMLLAFHPQLQAELIAAARTDDPDGVVSWRAGMMAKQMLVGLGDVVRTMGLGIGLPTEPALPDVPDPRHRRRLRTEAGEVLEWMAHLSHALSDHGDVLQERLDGLVREHDRFEQQLVELMG
ncbi:MAG: hypothetical protein R3F61_10840 [Myxococcota bacterium]